MGKADRSIFAPAAAIEGASTQTPQSQRLHGGINESV